MTKEAIIKRTTEIINNLPSHKAEEISDFASFVLKKYEDETLTEDIQILMSESGSLDFLLNESEGVYTIEDLKKRSNG
jgi:hypothetical protein